VKNSLLIPVILLSVYFFACNEKRKNNKPDIQVSIIKAFIEDSILFEEFSFKIRVHNYSAKSVTFNFKKSPRLNPRANQSDFNSWIKWEDSLGVMGNEVLLSPLFPAPIEIKPGVFFDFLFFIHSSNFSFIKKYRSNISEFDSVFYRLLDRRMYCLVTNSTVNKNDLIDSIPVTIDSSFSISFDKAYVKDFKK